MHLIADGDQLALFPYHRSGEYELEITGFQGCRPFDMRFDKGPARHIRVHLEKHSAAADIHGYALSREIPTRDSSLQAEGKSNRLTSFNTASSQFRSPQQIGPWLERNCQSPCRLRSLTPKRLLQIKSTERAASTFLSVRFHLSFGLRDSRRPSIR